ncbi:MAG: SOS response-associated peptidase family protein [Novosphingobium sp.]
MTVLYRLAADAPTIAARFGAAAGGDPWSGGTIAPGQFAPVITAGREAIAGPRAPGQPRRMIPRLWGVPPPPSAGDSGRGVLTVRNPDSPFWIGNLRNAEFRCLVPATALMAWGRPDPRSGKRAQCWLRCTDQPLFALAGVWKDSEIPSFALLTIQANAAWRDLGHEAMPAILPGDPAAWKAWLLGDWAQAQPLLAPYSSSLIAAG